MSGAIDEVIDEKQEGRGRIIREDVISCMRHERYRSHAYFVQMDFGVADLAGFGLFR